MHYGDVLIKYGPILDADVEELPFITDGRNTKFHNMLLKDGDVIIADTAEDETVGKATEIINIGSRKVVSGLHTFACRPLVNMTPTYLGFYINSETFHKQLYSLMQGVKVLSISKSNIANTIIRYPHQAEQVKICSLLNMIEARIVKQRHVIELLKKYKRGFVSAILSEKIKISDAPWEERAIGDFLTAKSIKQLPSTEAPLMAFTATGGVCDKGERYDRGFLVKDASSKLYKRTDYGDFIYSSNNLDVGSIGLNLYGSAVISDVYEIFAIDNADPWFISEVIQQKHIIGAILKYRQGCLYGQYRIYAEYFLSVKIRIPSLQIQEKIGSIISQVEHKILAEQGLLDNLEKYKATLLKKMFI